MKKISILVILTISVCFSTIHAQVSKGAIFLGGNLSFGTQKVNGAGNTPYLKQNVYSVSPAFGKVIRENLVLGFDAGISFSKSEYITSSFKNETKAYTAGVFLRQYRPLGKGFYLFLQERLGYQHEDYENTNTFNPGNDYVRNTVGLNVNPGLSYAINKKLHIETGFNNLFYLRYSHEKGNNYNNSSGAPYKANNFDAGVDLSGFSSLYFGFRLLLNK